MKEEVVVNKALGTDKNHPSNHLIRETVGSLAMGLLVNDSTKLRDEWCAFEKGVVEGKAWLDSNARSELTGADKEPSWEAIFLRIAFGDLADYELLREMQALYEEAWKDPHIK